MSDLKKIGDLLVLIGALVGLIQGILLILNMGFAFVNPLGGMLGGVAVGILGIIFSLIALVKNEQVPRRTHYWYPYGSVRQRLWWHTRHHRRDSLATINAKHSSLFFGPEMGSLLFSNTRQTP